MNRDVLHGNISDSNECESNCRILCENGDIFCPVKASKEVFLELEHQGLLCRMLSSIEPDIADPVSYPEIVSGEGTGTFNGKGEYHNAEIVKSCLPYRVNTIYKTDPQYGGHKLIHVVYNKTVIELGKHDDNEDFILIKNPDTVYKPLYLVIGLKNSSQFEKRVESGLLGKNDIAVIELAFNDPCLSFFTIFGGIPHCELTLDISGAAPNFFVTEPAHMGTHDVDAGKFQVEVIKQ